MSKSRWHQSLWSSFVSRFARTSRVSRRRSHLQRYGSAPAAELLETRVVPTVSATWNSGASTLTIANTGGGPHAVIVAEGQTSSQVFVDSVLFATITGATTASLTTIVFTGGAGTDSLTVTGNSPALNTVTLSGVEILTVNARPLGGTLTVSRDTNLDFGTSTIIGNLTVGAGGDVTDSGTLTVQPTSAVNSGTATISGTSITLNSDNNNFGHLALTSAGTATIVENGDTNFGVGATAVGSLVLTSTGNVTDSVNVVVGAGAGATTITAPLRNITLNSAGNNFGNLTLTGSNITIVETSATNLLATTATGTLNISSGGAITDGAALTIAGRATFTATGAGNDITLDNANSFGSISVNSLDDVTINEANDTELFTTTVPGNLSVTSAGAITDSGTVGVTGTTTLSAGGNAIILDSAANNFVGTVKFTGGGVTLVDGSGGIVLGSGAGASAASTLTVTATGAVTDGGVLTISGDTKINAVGQAITLTGDSFGVLFLKGATAVINETAATDLGNCTITGGTFTVTSTAGITNNTTPDVVTNGSGNYSTIVATNATVDLTAGAGTNITIEKAGRVASTFGRLILSGQNATIIEGGGTELGTVALTGSFNLTVVDGISPGGGVTQVGGTIITAGATTIDVGATYNIVLGNANVLGNLVFSGRNVTINENHPIVLGKRTSTTSTAGNTAFGNLTLTTTAGNSITQGVPGAENQQFGKLTVGGTARITAGLAGSITLNQVDPVSALDGAPSVNGNTFASLELTTTGVGDATILESGGSDLGTTNVNRNLSVTASGPISDSGIVTVGGTTTLDAGVTNPIVLDKNTGAFVPVYQNALTGAVTLTGNNLHLRNSSATVLGAVTTTGAFDLISVGAVTNPTLLVKVDGKTTIRATPASSHAVTLGSGTATQLSLLSVLGATNVSVTEAGDLDLFTTNPTGALTIIAGAGNITDSGTVTVDGNTSITTTGDITLNSAANNFDNGAGETFTFTGANNVTIVDLSGIDFNTSAGSTLTVSSTGPVTDTGTLTIGAGIGAVSVTSTGSGVSGNITLNEVANRYGTLSLKGTNVTIIEAAGSSPLTLGASTIGGTLALTINGDINQVGVIKALGPTTLTATGAGSDINLANNDTPVNTLGLDPLVTYANTFGGIVVGSGDNVVINEAKGTSIRSTSTLGTLTVTSAGAITQTGALAVTGVATFRNGDGISTGSLITLTTDANSFGSVVMTGGSMSLRETDGTGVDLTATSTGTLTVVSLGAFGDIVDVGALNIFGLATFTATTATSNIVLDNGSNTFGSITATAPQDLTIVETGATNLGIPTTSLTVARNLSVTSSGDVTDSGTIRVTGSTTIAASTNAITLNSSANDFDFGNSGDNFTFTGGNVTIVDANTIDLGTSTASGTLTVTTAAGGVTDDGSLTSPGTTTINAAGQAITLNGGTGTFGPLLLRGSSAEIDDNDVSTEIGTTAITGSLTVTATGSISQSGSSIVSGVTTLTGTGITLTGSGNVFGQLVLTAGAGGIAIKENAATDLGATLTTAGGTLSIISAGRITQSGTITVAGATTLTTPTAPTPGVQTIDLPTAGNTFGSLSITSHNVTIGETGGTDLGTSTISGTLSVNTGNAGAITDSGTVRVAGVTTLNAGAANAITIDDDGVGDATPGSFGKLRLTGLSANVTDSGAVELGNSSIGTGGLTIAYGGAVTDTVSEVIAVAATGVTSIVPIGLVNYAVTLDGGSSTYAGPIGLQGTNVLLINGVATALNNVIASGDVNITASGAITKNGATTIQASVATLTTIGGGNIGVSTGTTLSTAVGTLRLSTSGSAFITDAGDPLSLGTSNVGGDLVLRATGTTGTLTDSGVLTVGGTLTIHAGVNGVVFDQATSSFGAVDGALADLVIVNAGNVYLKDNGELQLGSITISGSLTLISSLIDDENITDFTGAVITVNGGPTLFNAGLGDVLINNGGHLFTGGRTGIGAVVTITTL